MSVLTRSPTCRSTESHVSRPVCIGASSIARYFPLLRFRTSRKWTTETRLESFSRESERASAHRHRESHRRETREFRTRRSSCISFSFFSPFFVFLKLRQADQTQVRFWCFSGDMAKFVNVWKCREEATRAVFSSPFLSRKIVPWRITCEQRTNVRR